MASDVEAPSALRCIFKRLWLLGGILCLMVLLQYDVEMSNTSLATRTLKGHTYRRNAKMASDESLIRGPDRTGTRRCKDLGVEQERQRSLERRG